MKPKQVFSALLAALLLCALLPVSSFAESASAPKALRTAEDFLAFAAGCAVEEYSAGRRFTLEADIDLTGTDFAPIPYFAGTFDGKGHLILGLSVTGDGSRQGLFRTVAEGAEISALTVHGTVSPGGSACFVGGIAGENCGRIADCSFEGRVVGVDSVGGIAGRNAGAVSGCTFGGAVLGEHRVGGIAGENCGSLNDCVSRGAVNTEAVTPRSESRFDVSALTEDDFLDLADLGGVAGDNSGVIAACRNQGDVGYRHTGYNVGGVAGRSSGFVSGCENRGFVTGRRDVGGIVGQLVPYAVWEISSDHLAALNGAIGGMNAILQSMADGTQSRTDQVRSELGVMNGYTLQALTALADVMAQSADGNRRLIDSVTVDPITGEVSFDSSAISWADLSALTAALGNMHAESAVLTGLAAEATGALAEDLRKIGAQMSYVMNTVGSAVSGALDIGVEQRDLSAAESYEHDLGAVDACFNYGGADGENNVGGVVGTIGFEVEFDRENVLSAGDLVTGNAEQLLFAVLRGCGSFGEIQARNDCVGCLAGEADVGAIVDSFGSGRAVSLSGDYVGGIAGLCRGTIRGCWSRSFLGGGRYVGGVAGLGGDLLDCRSWTHIENGSEYLGAVAGWAEGTVSGNLYAESLPAGVDGVSRTGQTRPVSAAELLGTEGVPADFDTLTVRFEVEGELAAEIEVPFGGGLETLPEVPNRNGQYWRWDDFDAEHIYYSMRVGGRYFAPGSVLSSGGEHPRFLVEGRFYEGQELRVADFVSGWEPEDELIETATLYVEGYEGDLTVRMYAPEPGVLYRFGEDGAWQRVPTRSDGQYVVFALPNGASFVYVLGHDAPTWLPWAIGGGAALLLGAAAALLVRRKKKKAAAAPDPEAIGGDAEP